MIKRRKDYEHYCRMKPDWIQLWQVGNSVYRVENIFNKEFWTDYIWWGWRGRRLWAFVRTLRKPIRYHSEAPTPEELERSIAEMEAMWRRMVESGAIERCIRKDVHAKSFMA